MSSEPGPDGTPLPGEAVVFRLGKGAGVMVPEDFHLSSEDKKIDPPRLSVWAKELTTTEQAVSFSGASRYTTAGRLRVQAVSELMPDPKVPAVTLMVVWEQAKTADGQPLSGPGAEGHAGIENLDSGQKAQRKSFYGKLARLVNDTAGALVLLAPS